MTCVLPCSVLIERRVSSSCSAVLQVQQCACVLFLQRRHGMPRHLNRVGQLEFEQESNTDLEQESKADSNSARSKAQAAQQSTAEPGEKAPQRADHSACVRVSRGLAVWGLGHRTSVAHGQSARPRTRRWHLSQESSVAQKHRRTTSQHLHKKNAQPILPGHLCLHQK